ncbi:uncharacterized protein LOC128125852 [Lactuca sativa]|uniref:uncharacterized protein LOC128125852 n=1 Tax=Lactuca sativa TaxID=4236 RepID=UPI000CC50DA0|nr:uncharacterized protein LOC128125852 [Lactuca sativa]
MGAPSSINHFRSISLPSRLTHPSCTKTEKKINELRASGKLVGSFENIQSSLVGLAELHVFVNEFVQAPKTQQALSHHQNETLVEAALEWSIGFLDTCSTLIDMIMLMKENVNALQMALRRKGSDSTVASKIAAYLCFRKMAKKVVTKSLRTLKHLEKKICSFLFVDIDHHVSLVSKVLKETNALTISLFRSILIIVSTKPKRDNGVQLIAKLLSKRTSTHKHDQLVLTEVETIELTLTLLHKNVRNGETKDVDVEVTLRRLQILDVGLEGLKVGLDHLFRRLIHSRVSLLNILVC